MAARRPAASPATLPAIVPAGSQATVPAASQATVPAEQRWARRRAAAVGVRAAIVGGPIAGSVVAMAVLSRVLPTPHGHTMVVVRIAWWTAILVGSLAAMWLVDRTTRRLAPLAALLDMAVLFPGRAPTRLKVARRAGDVRQLEALIVQSPGDVRSELAEAAEQILALVGSLRAHDRHTRGHSERVRVYTDLIAAELRLPPAAVDRLRWAALLHDIGKLRVPTATLNKPAKLSPPEWETIRRHPLAGAELASALLPWLGEWGKAIAEHHERFDGTGYPLGLSGREISLAGRVVALADSFEVMTASRSYKKAMTRATALEEVVRFSGTQFDPEVVRALLAVSAPRLRWAMGPTSWLVGTPVLGSMPSLTAAGVAAQAAVGVGTVAIAGVTGLAGPAAAAAPAAAAGTHVGTAVVAPEVTSSHSPLESAGIRSSESRMGAAPSTDLASTAIPAVALAPAPSAAVAPQPVVTTAAVTRTTATTATSSPSTPATKSTTAQTTSAPPVVAPTSTRSPSPAPSTTAATPTAKPSVSPTPSASTLSLLELLKSLTNPHGGGGSNSHGKNHG
jgi:putative nucleotidyltransferase with HDIG domain